MFILESPMFLEALADGHAQHSRDSEYYKSLEVKIAEIRPILKERFESGQGLKIGDISVEHMPYVQFGSINYLDLFGLDELILFAFYSRNRHRYHAVADLGANIGLHSIVMAKLGFSVTAVEPLPRHLDLLESNLKMNGVSGRVSIIGAAVAPEAGTVEFCNVLDNTTGSHILGAKREPYGPLETIRVDAVGIKEVISGISLVKMDVEGVESSLLEMLGEDDFRSMDLVLEVGSRESAEAIWRRFSGTKVNLFSQKLGWKIVEEPEGLPNSYREGSLFISRSKTMPWSSE